MLKNIPQRATTLEITGLEVSGGIGAEKIPVPGLAFSTSVVKFGVFLGFDLNVSLGGDVKIDRSEVPSLITGGISGSASGSMSGSVVAETTDDFIGLG